MNDAELDAFVNGITEDRVYEVVAGLAGGQGRRKVRGAMLYHVVEKLMASLILTDQSQTDLAAARVREAIVAVVKQSKRMGYVPNR